MKANRALALCKFFVSSRAVQILTQCRERVGAQGMFSANRIIPYLINAKGVVTAEGDNELLLIKVGREMLLGHEYEAPTAEECVASVPVIESVDYLISLVRARERSLLQRIRGALRSAPKHMPMFEVWNEQLTRTIEMASVCAVRAALEAFSAACDEVQEPGARRALDRLVRLFALTEIARFTTPLLLEQLIDREVATRIEEERRQLCASLFVERALLMDAFRVPTSLLAAPIAEDYLSAYDFLEREVRSQSFIQRSAEVDMERDALASRETDAAALSVSQVG